MTLAEQIQQKVLRERCIALESLVRLAVDLIPPTVFETQDGAELLAAIEQARIPAEGPQ